MPSGPARAKSASAPKTVATAMVRSPWESALRSAARSPSCDARVIRLNSTVARDRAMMECGSRYSWLATSSTALPGKCWPPRVACLLQAQPFSAGDRRDAHDVEERQLPDGGGRQRPDAQLRGVAQPDPPPAEARAQARAGA